jgi:uncharacterized membrane protein YvbJ
MVNSVKTDDKQKRYQLFNPINHSLKKRKDNRKILPYYLKK